MEKLISLILFVCGLSTSAFAQNTQTHLGLLKPGDVLELQSNTSFFGFSQSSLQKERESCPYGETAGPNAILTRHHICVPRFDANKGDLYRVVSVTNKGVVETMNQGVDTQHVEIAVRVEPVKEQSDYDQIIFAINYSLTTNPESDKFIIHSAAPRTRVESCRLLLHEVYNFYTNQRFTEELNKELRTLSYPTGVPLIDLAECENRLTQSQRLIQNIETAQILRNKIRVFMQPLENQNILITPQQTVH